MHLKILQIWINDRVYGIFLKIDIKMDQPPSLFFSLPQLFHHKESMCGVPPSQYMFFLSGIPPMIFDDTWHSQLGSFAYLPQIQNLWWIKCKSLRPPIQPLSPCAAFSTEIPALETRNKAFPS